MPEQPLHVIQRDNNREAIFFEDTDYERYADWLAAATAAYGRASHAYGLMTNHVHLLATPKRASVRIGQGRCLRTLGHDSAPLRRCRSRRTTSD